MIIQKRLPAEVTMQNSTFLNDRKINAELYALLLSYSYGDPKTGETIIYKKDLPNQTSLAAQIGIRSRNTYRTHLNYLIERGYVIDTPETYVLPKKEEVYLMLPLETVQFLKDALTEQVVKVYIYLFQRYKYKPGYTFTIQEIAEHIGLPVMHNQRNYAIINNALVCLKNNGLIDYAEFYENNRPLKRLVVCRDKVLNLC